MSVFHSEVCIVTVSATLFISQNKETQSGARRHMEVLKSHKKILWQLMSAQPCLSTRGKLHALSCREQRWSTCSVTAFKYLGQPMSRSSASPFTWLSIPSMSSMEKNRMAQRGETGNWVTASGYARKAKPGPGLWTETFFFFSFSLMVLDCKDIYLCRTMPERQEIGQKHHRSRAACSYLKLLRPRCLSLSHAPWSQQWKRLQSQQTCWYTSWCSTRWLSLWGEEI